MAGFLGILVNYLNTTDKDLLAQRETEELELTYKYYNRRISADDTITPLLIKSMHKKWLGKIYPCAGKYRTVFMTKGTFPFASPQLIDSLMRDFAINILNKYTPSNFSNIDDLSLALGIVHSELILIHPFREGNGRISRLVANIMSLQSGYPPLDFSSIMSNNTLNHHKYIASIHAGLDRNYIPMKQVFIKIINDSLEKI